MLLAGFGSARFSNPIAAVGLGALCAVAPPMIGASVVFIAANDPHLLRESAIGPFAPVDIAIIATFARATFAGSRTRPRGLEWVAIGFLVAGAIATVVAPAGSASTAFLRIASYVTVGLAVGRALRGVDRVRLARAFVSAEAGQATAALIRLTPAIPTDFPIGRYVGTLHDPAQFGIPVAFAGILAATSTRIVPPRFVRRLLVAVIGVAVLGSATRSAWAVFGGGLLISLLDRAKRGRGRLKATAVMGTALIAAVFAAILVTLYANSLGLNSESSSIRRYSIEAGWTYLRRHPFHPLGLGNPPHQSVAGANTGTSAAVSVNSSFERSTSGWRPYRHATVAPRTNGSPFGRGSLQVTTSGETTEEGTELGQTVEGIRSHSEYTFSLWAKIPRRVKLWLYVDEYHNGRWTGYGYKSVSGTGVRGRYSRVWRTQATTNQLKLYIVSAERLKATFSLDAVQLALGHRVRFIRTPRDLPVGAHEPSLPYNTWLAVAIELSLLAAALLGVLAIGAPYRAYHARDRPTAYALSVLLIPAMTENLLYGADFVALLWLFTLSLVATTSRPVREPIRAPSNKALKELRN
jgi:hypothetical protein